MSRLYKCLLMQEICLIKHNLCSPYWPKYKLLRLKSVHGIFIWLPPWYFHWLIEKGIVGLALQITGKLWMQVPRNFLSTMLACKPVHLGIDETLYCKCTCLIFKNVYNGNILCNITPPTSFQPSHWLKWRHVTAQYFTILGQLQKIWG